ncbi:hypothetical protein ES703_35290 [subsurface metagenome]
MRIAQSKTASGTHLRLLCSKRPGGQSIEKGAGDCPFLLNQGTSRQYVFNVQVEDTLSPDVVQGLPWLTSAQFTLRGDIVYPRSQDRDEARRLEDELCPELASAKPLPGQEPLPFEGYQLKLYPGLSVAALKARVDKELALWYELRAINATGSSRLLLNDTLASLVKHFGYSQATAYRLLKAGKGKFWDIRGSKLSGGFGGRSVVKIEGLLQMAEWFNTSVFRLGRPVEVRASDFKGRRAKTAWLYASFFKPEGSRAKPVSRDSIKAATGVKRRQQRRYDKVAGIKRVANFACYQDSQGKLHPLRHLVDGKSRQWLKDRRLGNTYHSRGLSAPRGMTKRVNAELRHRSLISGEATGVLLKRFFLSARSLIKSPERANEAFLLVNKGDRLIKGRMEWCIA